MRELDAASVCLVMVLMVQWTQPSRANGTIVVAAFCGGWGGSCSMYLLHPYVPFASAKRLFSLEYSWVYVKVKFCTIRLLLSRAHHVL